MAGGRDSYSRLVAVLKIGLPLLALVLLGSMFLVTMEDDFEGGIVFEEADLAQLGQGLRITRPVLTGMTRGQDPFRFSADLVVPDAAPPTRAAIEGLEGQLDFVGGPSVTVESPEAALDLESEKMELTGRVTITSDHGYRVTADRMAIDLVEGTLLAQGQVDGTGPMGAITSQTLRIVPAEGDASRHVFSFGEGVRLVYDGADGTER